MLRGSRFAATVCGSWNGVGVGRFSNCKPSTCQVVLAPIVPPSCTFSPAFVAPTGTCPDTVSAVHDDDPEVRVWAVPDAKPR